MAQTYKALALLLSYPREPVQELAPVALDAIADEGLVPESIVRSLGKLVDQLASGDLLDLQEAYVLLFDRTRALSLNLYEHVHGESRDRGQAMAALVELYRQHGLELSASELPDHLPVFLEFLSILPDARAASLLGEAVHVLEALTERLHKRQSPYRAVLGALAALADGDSDAEALSALLSEPDEDPENLEALDKAWEETAVTFGPSDVGCPKAHALVAAMNTEPAASPRRVGAAA